MRLIIWLAAPIGVLAALAMATILVTWRRTPVSAIRGSRSSCRIADEALVPQLVLLALVIWL
jgi:hypothetical protein